MYGNRQSSDSGGILFPSTLWRYIKSLSKSYRLRYLIGLSLFSRGRIMAKKTSARLLHLQRELFEGLLCGLGILYQSCHHFLSFYKRFSDFWMFILHSAFHVGIALQASTSISVVTALMTISTNSTARYSFKRIIFPSQL